MMKKYLRPILPTLVVICFFNITAFAQTLTLAVASDVCGFNGRQFTKTATSGGRNIFSGTMPNGSSGFTSANIQYSSLGARWELITIADGLAYYISNISSPNPPLALSWVDVLGLDCGTLSIGSILPVELTAFDAQTTARGKTQLTWATASEHNNKGFEIEKSTDGVRFEKIGFVAGAGNSSREQRYTFEDAAPSEKSASIIYYRLKQLDTDGQFEYSKIVSVRNNKRNTSIQIYPTTTSDVLRVAADGAPTDAVTVFNQMGQVVLTAQQVSSVDMSALPAGLYLVQVASGQEQVTERVFKQ